MIAPLALSACALPPKGVDQATIARFDNAVVSLDCKLVTEPHYVAAEFQSGLTRDQVVEMISYKAALGQAVAREEGGYQFTLEGCP